MGGGAFVLCRSLLTIKSPPGAAAASVCEVFMWADVQLWRLPITSPDAVAHYNVAFEEILQIL